MIDDRHALNARMGFPKTPEAVAVRMVDLVRQTYRTTTLVEALPKDGRAIIVVWNAQTRGYIVDRIKSVWGPSYPWKTLTFITIDELKSDKHKLRGLIPMPVFVDNAVLDILSIQYVERLNELFNPKAPMGRSKVEEDAFWKTVSKMAAKLREDPDLWYSVQKEMSQ